jgi:hypothetical protein
MMGMTYITEFNVARVCPWHPRLDADCLESPPLALAGTLLAFRFLWRWRVGTHWRFAATMAAGSIVGTFVGGQLLGICPSAVLLRYWPSSLSRQQSWCGSTASQWLNASTFTVKPSYLLADRAPARSASSCARFQGMSFDLYKVSENRPYFSL